MTCPIANGSDSSEGPQDKYNKTVFENQRHRSIVNKINTNYLTQTTLTNTAWGSRIRQLLRGRASSQGEWIGHFSLQGFPA